MVSRASAPVAWLSQAFLRNSNTKSVGLLIGLAAAVVWRVQQLTAQLLQITSLPALDYRTEGYSAAEVYNLFNKYGERGIKLFLDLNLVDFATPAVFGILLCLIAGPLLQKAGLPTILNLLPFSFSLFDIAENVTVRYLLHAYPAQKPHIAQLASVFTQLKYLCNIPAFGVVLVALLGYIWAWSRGQTAGKRQSAATHAA